MSNLSPRMKAALSRLALGAVTPWAFGWGTYKALLRRGLVHPVKGSGWNDTARLTPEGRDVAREIRAANERHLRRND